MRFKVVHHATANMIEDEDEDPVGFFFNEYALGKNGDIFPEDSGRLIKAGSKIHFNLHLHPSGERIARQPVDRLQAVCRKGQVPKYVAFTQHMGDNTDLDIPPGEIVADRRLLPAAASRRSCRRFSRTCTIAARRCAWKRSIRTSAPIPRGPARRAPRRSAASATISSAGTSRIRTPKMSQPLLPAGTIIHITAWHDNTRGEQIQPEPAQLGRLRPADRSTR